MATPGTVITESSTTSPSLVIEQSLDSFVCTKDDESETEDEEVKMNCIGGFRGIEDSDMCTSDNDDDDDDLSDEEEEDEPSERSRGVVNFVSSHLPTVQLVRPHASSPPRTNLSPLDEVGEASDSSSTSCSSVGARGVPLTLDTNSVVSESQEDAAGYAAEAEQEEDDNEEGEDEEDDDGDMDQDDEDDELSGILESLSENMQGSDPDDSDSVSERHIGVTSDRDNDDLVTIPKAKRVLSFNTLTALSNDVGCLRDSPKRQKSMKTGDLGSPPPLLGFSLGPPALPGSLAPATSLPKCMLQYRKPRESPLISSSDEEVDALDRQLGEELVEEIVLQERRDQNNSPVPLLTPPDSPLTVEINGHKGTMCEWPSNLAVDSAMVAAINEMRSMSPASLDDFEREEEGRVLKLTEAERMGASTLTPMLKGISVSSR